MTRWVRVLLLLSLAACADKEESAIGTPTPDIPRSTSSPSKGAGVDKPVPGSLPSATGMGAVALPEMGQCVSDCGEGDADAATCRDRCRAQCEKACERPGQPTGFAEACRNDCAQQIDRLAIP